MVDWKIKPRQKAEKGKHFLVRNKKGHHFLARVKAVQKNFVLLFWYIWNVHFSLFCSFFEQKYRIGLAVLLWFCLSTLKRLQQKSGKAVKIHDMFKQYPTNKINRTGVILRVFRTLTLIQIINSAQNYIAHSRHEVEIVWCETQMRWLSWWEAWKLVGCNGVQSGSCDRGVAPLVGPQECRGLKWMSVAEEGERRGRKVQTTKCSPTGGAEMFSEFIQ